MSNKSLYQVENRMANEPLYQGEKAMDNQSVSQGKSKVDRELLSQKEKKLEKKKEIEKIKDIEKKRDLGIYIHIPFCAKKCDYCDFLSAPCTDKEMKEYFEALYEEIEQYRGHVNSYVVPTIFIGGGTPSVVASSYIEKTLSLIKEVFQIDDTGLEATIEINPGTVSIEKLESYQKSGINRISFGLQSANNQDLKLLGRIHTYEQFEQNYHLARELGFTNINIDLMSALPGQTCESWERTLKQVLQLKPDHISAYSLIIEEGTKFYDMYREGVEGHKLLPDEETDRQIYHRTKELLKNSGYQRYEVSNYSKPGYECRHNLSYWIGTEYLGLGLGASSYMAGARFSNVDELDKYIQINNHYDTYAKSSEYNKIMKNKTEDNKTEENRTDEYITEDYNIEENTVGNSDKKQKSYENIIENPTSSFNLKEKRDKILTIRKDYRELTKKERMEEFMFLGLRVCEGISKSNFYDRFGTSIDEFYGVTLEELSVKKLIMIDEDNIKLTEYGVDISNYVLAEFLLD